MKALVLAVQIMIAATSLGAAADQASAAIDAVKSAKSRVMIVAQHRPGPTYFK